MSTLAQPVARQTFSWFVFGLMGSVTFVHLHLDYVYTARSEGATNTSRKLFEGIARWHEVKKTQTLKDARERALKGIEEEVSKGVQFIRTHIDVTDPKLTGLKAMLEIRDQLKDNVTIQIVAFPQEGMYAYKGCLDLITYNGAKTLNLEDQYSIEVGKPANFLVLNADTPFEAVRQRADVLASIRNGEYLFKRPEPSYEIDLDLFRNTRSA